MKTIFALSTAGSMEWRDPHISFHTLEELKAYCVEHYGFPEEILTDDEVFDEELQENEMKYDEVPLPEK
jgi:hypothetical protein